MKPSVEYAPRWAKWLAQNADGKWYWFEYQPTAVDGEWHAVRYTRKELANPEEVPWHETLEEIW